MRTGLKEPEIVLKDGKPARVILDIADYEELLERVEDAQDLEALAALRRKPLSFRKFDDYLAERRQRVHRVH